MDAEVNLDVRTGKQPVMQKASPALWTRMFGPELLRTTGLGLFAMVLALLGLSAAGREMQGLMMVIGVGWSASIIGAMQGKLGARTSSFSASSLNLGRPRGEVGCGGICLRKHADRDFGFGDVEAGLIADEKFDRPTH